MNDRTFWPMWQLNTGHNSSGRPAGEFTPSQDCLAGKGYTWALLTIKEAENMKSGRGKFLN